MSKGGLSKEDTKTEHPFQAIVLCDGWGEDERWGPLVRRKRTDDEEFDDLDVGGEQRPWCLVPLLNIPLLAWTLESLSASGVEQAFLFVRDGVEEVRQWLASSSFQAPGSDLTIVVRPTKALTPGDVMREVDGLQILAPTDYLVVQAGFLGNVDLKQKVQEFGARRQKDPSLSMSCIVKPIATKTHSTFAVHTLTSDAQLMHYEQSPLFPKLRTFTVPREALGGGKEVHIRSDLEAVGAVICSVEVAPLFTENFDYQFFYPDFVNGLLTSDLLGKTICCTILDSDPSSSVRAPAWAGAVTNTKSYDAVSRAILARKAYPLAPDENMPDRSGRYEQRRARVYYGKDVDLSRTCKISSTSLVGTASAIGPNTFITHSVLGASVATGSSCALSNAYVFAGAKLGDGCVVRDSIVGEGAVLAPGAVVEGGSLVAAGVVLGPGAKIVGARVSLEPYDGEVAVGESTLGEGGTGYFWPAEELGADDEDSDDEDALDPRNLSVTRLGHKLGNLHLSSSSSSLSSLSRNGSTTSLDTGASMTDEEGLTDSELPTIAGLDALQPEVSTSKASSKQSEFVTECLHSLDRSFAESHTVDNAAIELKTLRMASNVDLGEVRRVVVPYVLRRCGGAAGAGAVLARWGGLVANLTGEQEDAMVDCLLVAQEFVATEGAGDARFWLRVLKGFYETDVVSDEGVFAWYKSAKARATAGDEGKKLWGASRPFLEAIQEDEDDDEDEDDEDSDDEE
ncbi:translation initiation factor eIF2B catalytic subunit epsilon [Rhodotorula paludigena]|uniref:translation initiation factor eIF2B catalytic subunit epsilon n=1 Tax=Rhodotorula paludigena TaxID=86838 RepID=UPI00317F8193